MHILTLTDQVNLGPKDIVLPGVYATEDYTGAQLMARAGGGTMSPLIDQKPFDETKDWNGKRVLMMRVGGFGDIILMTPVLREMKRRWPTISIDFACMNHYGVVLANLPYVNQVVGYPVGRHAMECYDAWIFFENAIEKNPRAEKMHMTDLFAEIAGFKGTVRDLHLLGKGEPALQDKKPDYIVSNNETIWVMEQYPRNAAKRRVCIQVSASGKCRVYPVQKLGQAVAELLKKGWEVFLMGAIGDVVGVKEQPGLRNLAAAGLTFRQSCAVINNADAFIGSDSALLHIAGALGIPAVGLYGPFPADLRTRYCPTTVALSGKGSCAPCFHHANLGRKNDFPDDCPSRARNVCQVLEKIAPDDIVRNVERIAKKFELKEVE